MNEARQIALEFAMRLNPTCESVALEMARKFEAYLVDENERDILKESRDTAQEDRRLVICDRVWLAPITKASCLMIETCSPFVSSRGFYAELLFGDQTYVAHFGFSGVCTTKGSPFTSMHFRATKLTSVPTGYQSLPVPKLVLSGPDLPGSAEHV